MVGIDVPAFVLAAALRPYRRFTEVRQELAEIEPARSFEGSLARRV